MWSVIIRVRRAVECQSMAELGWSIIMEALVRMPQVDWSFLKVFITFIFSIIVLLDNIYYFLILRWMGDYLQYEV